MQWIKKKNRIQPVIIALITFLVIILSIDYYSKYRDSLKERDLRNKQIEVLISKKSQLEKSLYSRIYYTKSVAAYVGLNTNISNDNFYKLASKFCKNDSVINTMSLSKDCILNAIYPLEGHEAALGLNLMAHPKRKDMVEKSIVTQKTFVAGPVELVEGGIAFISYTPIFFDSLRSSDRFWGVTDIVILRDELFAEANVVVEDENFIYALQGEDGSGMFGKVFWGDSSVFKKSPVQIDINLPTGSWVFASAPKNGWSSYIETSDNLYIVLYALSVIISILIWLLSRAYFIIRSNERELKALFGSMQDIIIEFNRKCEYIKIAPTNDTLLFLPKKDLIGKSLVEVFDEDKAKFFVDAINQCFETKKMVLINYPLMIKGVEYWFQARISYMSDNSVLYVANDNTEKIKAEKILIESEKKLKELNDTKDKFFSIIAHDLINPLSNLKNLSKILADSYNELEEKDRIEFIELVSESADNLFQLLGNLLVWSRSQSGKIEFIPSKIKLNECVEETYYLLHGIAESKKISLINNVPEDFAILADPNMIKTIIRNLVSNSIKFTPNQGKITVSAEKYTEYIKVIVEDTGVGISPDKIEKLFRIGENMSSPGTNQEKGSGLGLILCKEFIDKHNGNIWVESIVGEGAKFIFTLPI